MPGKTNQPNIEGAITEKLLKLEILTLSQEIFKQIQLPDYRGRSRAEWLEEAERSAVAIIITKDGEAWLLVQGEARLWRWGLGNQANLGLHYGQYPWLDKLPQVYLVKRHPTSRNKP